MRTLAQTKAEVAKRKQRGTKQPFNLIYFLLCENCRSSVLDQADLNARRAWKELREVLEEGCGCRRFLTRAEKNMQKYRSINFERATWPKKSRIEELEEYRVKLVLKSQFSLGLSKKETFRNMENEVFWGSVIDAPDRLEIMQDHEEKHIAIKRIRSLVLSRPIGELKVKVSNVPNISAGRLYAKPDRQFLSANFDARHFLTPYGWSYRELNRKLHPKISA